MHSLDADRLAAIAKERDNLKPPPFLGLTEMRAYAVVRLRHRDGSTVCFHARRSVEFCSGDDVFSARPMAASMVLLKSITLEEANDFLKKHNMLPSSE
jgi:hypothetical protein